MMKSMRIAVTVAETSPIICCQRQHYIIQGVLRKPLQTTKGQSLRALSTDPHPTLTPFYCFFFSFFTHLCAPSSPPPLPRVCPAVTGSHIPKTQEFPPARLAYHQPSSLSHTHTERTMVLPKGTTHCSNAMFKTLTERPKKPNFSASDPRNNIRSSDLNPQTDRAEHRRITKELRGDCPRSEAQPPQFILSEEAALLLIRCVWQSLRCIALCFTEMPLRLTDCLTDRLAPPETRPCLTTKKNNLQTSKPAENASFSRIGLKSRPQPARNPPLAPGQPLHAPGTVPPDGAAAGTRTYRCHPKSPACSK
ncbi:hypothetical protein CRENBAI_003694 [Crenichthys baileyi]|uniref:Uncharacterized protein n=1 Tax=Crenichthys baileyi TaxID=28760 RepID=A0AAV9QMX1_9TELE